MSTYYCLFGNTPDLSFRELEALIKPQAVELVLPNIAQCELADDQAAQAVQDQAGGIIKIYRSVKEIDHQADEDALMEIVGQTMLDLQIKEFGLAEFGRDHLPAINEREVKSWLKELGVITRFRGDSRLGLSAAVLLHQTKVQELAVIRTAETSWIAQLVTVQDIDNWTKLDRSKPYSNRKKGMLPPKLARMMVNIGLGHLEESKSAVVYDPFCGTGTTLIEAAVRGTQTVVGSDIDPESAEGTIKNLEWLAKAYGITFTSQVQLSDVSHFRWPEGIARPNLIVTEPFLGKQTPNESQLDNIFKGLEKLYLGAFKQWARFLVDGAVVVIVFPVVQAKRTYSMQNLIDKLASLGYTMVSEPVMYHRPLAVVQRQITVFRWKAS